MTPRTKKDIKTKRWTFQLILLVFLVIHMMAFLVWQNIEGLGLDESIKRLEKEYIGLYHLHQKELLDYIRLANSNEMRELAKRNLNLVETHYSDFLVVDLQDIEDMEKREDLKNIELEKP